MAAALSLLRSATARRPGTQAPRAAGPLVELGRGAKAPEPCCGTVLGGKYRLIRHLASGGMGAVWEAEHLALGMPVAVKLMAPVLLSDRSLRARFELEARASARLRSSNVVAVHDYGVDAGIPHIVMELLEGEDLGALLRRRGRLGASEALGLAAQIGRGLASAHAAGIVHRDLKPRNVFVARVDGEPVVKLLDFGLAKATSSEPWARQSRKQTNDEAVLGSPPYMAPEQIRGASRCDQRTDLWALAVIVFRMLTAKLPFPGETASDIFDAVTSGEIPSARALAPDLPPGIDAFFERAFARKPAARFGSAAELVAALSSACAVDQSRDAIAPAAEDPADDAPTLVDRGERFVPEPAAATGLPGASRAWARRSARWVAAAVIAVSVAAVGITAHASKPVPAASQAVTAPR